MFVNEYGIIVQEEWFRSAKIRREVELFGDEFVVMPNYVHGIVWIVELAMGMVNIGATGRSPLPSFPRGPARRSLSSFVASFKSAVTKRINEHRGTPGVPVWQRNYYEHIIRDEDDLKAIRRYIACNFLRWHPDHENMRAIGTDPWEGEWSG